MTKIASLLLLVWAVASSAMAAESCLDLSGVWQFDHTGESCGGHNSTHEWQAMTIPADGGCYLPVAPVTIRIRQDGCQELRFIIVSESTAEYENARTYGSYKNAESVFDLSSTRKRAITWSPDSLTVRYRVKDRSARIFPGFGRVWSEWTLKQSDQDHLVYDHSLVHRGAAFFVFPYKNETTFHCTLTRVE